MKQVIRHLTTDDILIMSCLICWVWILNEVHFNSVQSVTTYVQWNVENHVIHLGEPINLTCTVHGVTSIDLEVSRQWAKGSNHVCHNGITTNPDKYKEYISGNHFKLEIRNITESDLNCKYQCRYSFETDTKTLDINTDNFEYLPTADMTYLECMYTTETNLKVKLHLEKIFPLPNCTLVIEDVSFQLTNNTNNKHEFYFDVSFVNQLHIRLKHSTECRAICHLIQEYTVASSNIEVKGDKSQENAQFLGFISVIPVVALLVVVWKHRKRRSKITKMNSEQICLRQKGLDDQKFEVNVED